jgi:hypothetical protein
MIAAGARNDAARAHRGPMYGAWNHPLDEFIVKLLSLVGWGGRSAARLTDGPRRDTDAYLRHGHGRNT